MSRPENKRCGRTCLVVTFSGGIKELEHLSSVELKSTFIHTHSRLTVVVTANWSVRGRGNQRSGTTLSLLLSPSLSPHGKIAHRWTLPSRCRTTLTAMARLGGPPVYRYRKASCAAVGELSRPSVANLGKYSLKKTGRLSHVAGAVVPKSAPNCGGMQRYLCIHRPV